MTLNDAQQKLVVENMGLVRAVIARSVHRPGDFGIYAWDDLFQIGCIGLCKAAYSYDSGGNAMFTTYAYTLVRNEIYKALEYASRRKRCELLCQEAEDLDQTYIGPECTELLANGQMQTAHLERLLRDAQRDMTGVASKGVDAMLLRGQGLTCKEIGELFGAKANEVTAWISKARKLLKADPAFILSMRECV